MGASAPGATITSPSPGTEANPRAGSNPIVLDGGASAAAWPQAVSGAAPSVQASVAPVRKRSAGSAVCDHGDPLTVRLST